MVEMNLIFPKGTTNEYQLFHGTKSPKEIVKNGFSLEQSSKLSNFGKNETTVKNPKRLVAESKLWPKISQKCNFLIITVTT